MELVAGVQPFATELGAQPDLSPVRQARRRVAGTHQSFNQSCQRRRGRSPSQTQSNFTRVVLSNSFSLTVYSTTPTPIGGSAQSRLDLTCAGCPESRVHLILFAVVHTWPHNKPPPLPPFRSGSPPTGRPLPRIQYTPSMHTDTSRGTRQRESGHYHVTSRESDFHLPRLTLASPLAVQISSHIKTFVASAILCEA